MCNKQSLAWLLGSLDPPSPLAVPQARNLVDGRDRDSLAYGIQLSKRVPGLRTLTYMSWRPRHIFHA